MTAVTYPTDTSGKAPTNFLKNELHSVSEAHFRDYYFIVPKFAPFFVDDFEIRTIGDTGRTLVEDVDFSFALPYVTGTRVTGKQMYGAITLHNLDLNGILSMDYRTIGGDEIADRLQVLQVLAEKAYNPRTTIWDVVADVPNAFPPTPHYEDYANFFGQEEVVKVLAEIRDAILTNSSLTSETIRDFLGRYNNERGGFVLRNGDTMKGPLSLPGDPSLEMHAVTKQYVDGLFQRLGNVGDMLAKYVLVSDFNTNLNTKLNLTGGILTGPLSLNADPQVDEHAATKRYVDLLLTELTRRVDLLERIVTGFSESGFITRKEVEAMFHEMSLRVISSK